MKDYKGIIVQNKEIAQGIYEMEIESSAAVNFPIEPGQFLHLRIPQASHLLMRRPFSINTVNKEKGTITIIYQIKGEGTALLSKVACLQVIDFLCPLGNGFRIAPQHKNVFLVGGGIGIAPLRYAAERNKDRFFYSFLGFRNHAVSYQTDVFHSLSERIWIASEDGSIGNKGFITQYAAMALEKEKPDLILGCGPLPMLKALQKLAEQHNIECQISLEERMGCGVGGCLVCNCKVYYKDGWEYKRVCADGPVFDSREVCFDDGL